MSRTNSTESTQRQQSIIIGLLGLLGVLLVGFGAVQANTISIALGGGALMVALATYSAIGDA